MIRKINHNRGKKNFLIIILAIILVFLLIFFKNGLVQNKNLESNILSIRKQQTEKKQTDIIYEVITGKIYVYSNSDISNIYSGIEIKFYYDYEKVNILNKDIFSDYDFDIQKDTGTIILNMNLTGNLENNNKILGLNISGNKEDIVLGEVTLQDLEGKQKSLSIGLK